MLLDDTNFDVDADRDLIVQTGPHLQYETPVMWNKHELLLYLLVLFHCWALSADHLQNKLRKKFL